MNTIRNIILVTGTLVMAIASCKHDPEPVVPVVTRVCFQEDILPVFQTNCAKPGCHDPNAATDGYVLNSYQNIMAKGITPFNPGNSKIYESITETDVDERMPKSPQPALTSEQIQLIYAWIAQGATNDSCTGPCDTTDVKYSVQVTRVINDHCIGCHKGPSSTSGYNLEGYTNLKTWVDNGKLAKTINHEVGVVPMPYMADKMPECQIRTIQLWIDNGAPNN